MPGSNHCIVRDIEIRADLVKTFVIHRDVVLWGTLIHIASLFCFQVTVFTVTLTAP